MSGSEKLNIREWAPADRPRERMLTMGPKALTDAELVAILLRSGSTANSAVDLAKKLLKQAGNDLNSLAKLSVAELMRQKGVGEAKALSILAALELGGRRADHAPGERPKVVSSAVAYDLLRPMMADLQHEQFWLLALDRGLRLMDRFRISQGGMHGTVVDPKVVFKEAIDRRASVLVLGHNHPSGQLKPSQDDLDLTRKLVGGGTLLDISVQDHLILGAGGYFSMKDHGMM
jgi:DNA repair protein RadC